MWNKAIVLLSVLILFTLAGCSDVGNIKTAVYRVNIGSASYGHFYVDNFTVCGDWFVGQTDRGNITWPLKDVRGVVPNPYRK